jgi:hypothetical protein
LQECIIFLKRIVFKKNTVVTGIIVIIVSIFYSIFEHPVHKFQANTVLRWHATNVTKAYVQGNSSSNCDQLMLTCVSVTNEKNTSSASAFVN